MNTELHLRIAGGLMLLLVLVNLYVPRRFNWRGEMAALSLLNRQIFLVHAGFICIVLAMFAALSIGLAAELLKPTPLARAVLGGIALFWLLRLLTQWFVYDWRIWRGDRFNTVGHFVFTALWTYFTGVYAYAFWLNLSATA
jgi:hypothetical protein